MRVRPLDVVLAVWVAVWIWAALEVRDAARGITQTTARIEQVGAAVEETGQAIERLGELPIVGGDVAEVGRTVQQQGREASAAAREGRRSGVRLANLLAAAVGLIPTLPVLLLYVPRRLRQEREVRAVAEALDDPQVQSLLARRAAMHLPLDDVLATLGRDDARDVLAQAELRRLGLDRRLSR